MCTNCQSISQRNLFGNKILWSLFVFACKILIFHVKIFANVNLKKNYEYFKISLLIQTNNLSSTNC